MVAGKHAREACEKEAAEALARGQHVVIDRTNIDAAQRANAIWKQAINDYEQPPLDPAILEELEEYVERRKRELIGADAVLR